ncbi:LOW QUALITY PROTEIN: hypothetical protein ACHAXA_001888 [Cyclostephanos tholiformis]|uniref:Uncharacterized protein n=1 Tax=Cyclostephanos tholiformis TaxID=382380 RepID=A0ABD3RU59_9STRA
MAKRRMRALLASCDGNSLTDIFETYAIELLERGGTFPCRQLGSAHIQGTETSLKIRRSEKIVVDSVSSNQTANQLYVPKTKNYAAIDAWMPAVGAFQVMVGKNHGINNRAEDDLARLGEANRLYWVLPPEHYHSFTKKNPKMLSSVSVSGHHLIVGEEVNLDDEQVSLARNLSLAYLCPPSRCLESVIPARSLMRLGTCQPLSLVIVVRALANCSDLLDEGPHFLFRC